MRSPKLLSYVGMLAVCFTVAHARADSNDLTLERIVGPLPPGASSNDPNDVVRQTQYKSLMSELAVVMAPRLLSPADTLGFSGFQVSFESSFTQISHQSDFWQKGVEHVSSGFLPTLSVFARKGIWLPLPGFELGAGGTKLLGSSIYALQAYAKLALHEGFHGLPIPSFAVRGAVSRLVGTSEVDLTIVSIDASISKSFGLGGTVKLDPYLGGNALLTFVRGAVLDLTPSIDAFKQGPGSLDLNANTTFADPDTIVRWRLFAGFRLVYSIFALTGEFTYTLCNDSGAHCGQADPNHVVDRSGGQAQISFSGSLIF